MVEARTKDGGEMEKVGGVCRKSGFQLEAWQAHE